MINLNKIYIFALLFFLCQNTMSTECVRLFSPFKSTIKGADIAVAGEIIYNDIETGKVFVRITERFFGNCQDTISCFDNGWGVEFIRSKSGDKVILLLYEWNNSDSEYYLDECGCHVLFFNHQKNKFYGNMKYSPFLGQPVKV